MESVGSHLRPLSIGDLLDRTVRMYRHHFLSILGILLGPWLLMLPFEVWLARRFGFWIRWQVALDPLAVPLFTLFILITNSIYVLSGAALIQLLATRYLGIVSGFRNSYRRAIRCAFPVMWVAFLESLLWCVPSALATAVGVTGLIRGGPWWWYLISFSGIEIAITVCGAVIGLFRLSLASLIVVIEERSWTRSFQRSWVLMRRNTWRAVIITFFSVAASWAASFAISIPMYIGEALRPGVMQGAWGVAMHQMASVLSAPLATVAFVLLYFDILVRREALDLEMMARNLGLATSAGCGSP